MAAGESKRLRPLTEEIPKTLLQLDESQILEHILNICKSLGLKDFHLVVGHGKDKVRDFISGYAEKNPELSFNLIHNAEYNTKGNIYSMYTGKHLFDEDFILINSDTIFHANILRNLLEHPEANVLAIDDYKELSDEEMKVYLDSEGKIIRIHKKLNPQDADGEYIGVLKIGSQYAADLISGLEETLARDASLYYEDALQVLMDRGIPFHKASTQGLPCMEIDTHEDLANAKNLILKIKV